MNPDEVAFPVLLYDQLGVSLVHIAVIRPHDLLGSPVGRFMLLVVKQCVEFMFGITSTRSLFDGDDFVVPILGRGKKGESIVQG